MMSAPLRYRVLEYDTLAHEFGVRLEIARPDPAGQTLMLPAWIPGSYMIRDFARNVTSIVAHDERGRVTLRKRDKQTWVAPPCDGTLVVDYRVYAYDLSVRAAFLDSERAFFNGTSLFLAVDGQRDVGWTLELRRPETAQASAWRVATALPVLETDDRGFGRYGGDGYALLIDCPVEIADYQEAGFAVLDRPHRVVFSEAGQFDLQRVCRDLAPICLEHASMFGDLPVHDYLFLTLATADGYGGLEHRDSTSLICRRSDLPAPEAQTVERGYRRFLGLCSHEYFHLWNVKRIRPAAIASSDLAGEAHTELLWAFEGITSYYDYLALARSGVIAPRDYLDTLAQSVTRVLRNPGRLRQSIAESSFDTWTKFYKQDENAANAIVSYYTKGALVAFGLDVTLRRQSADTLSLDDVMRSLWERHGRTETGVPERGIEHVVAELLGHDLADFFTDYVYGTTELPLAEWLADVGVGLRKRPARGPDDEGGYAETAEVAKPRPSLGARYEQQSTGLRLTHVLAGSPAQAAGLAPGDHLVALDREMLRTGTLDALLARATRPTVELHYFRRDRLAVTQLPVRPPAEDTCDLYLLPDDQLAPAVAARRAAWFASSASAGA